MEGRSSCNKSSKLAVCSSLALMEEPGSSVASEASTTSEDLSETPVLINDEETLTESNHLDENLEFIRFCHDMDDYQRAFEERCIHVQRNMSSTFMSRDYLMERMFQKAWLTLMVRRQRHNT